MDCPQRFRYDRHQHWASNIKIDMFCLTVPLQLLHAIKGRTNTLFPLAFEHSYFYLISICYPECCL